MSNAALLLKMLEPAVRPVAAAGSSAARSAPTTPLEQRSFEDLLAEARTAEPAPSPPDAASAPVIAGPDPAPDLVRPLAQVDRLANASLCDLLARRSSALPPTAASSESDVPMVSL